MTLKAIYCYHAAYRKATKPSGGPPRGPPEMLEVFLTHSLCNVFTLTHCLTL